MIKRIFFSFLLAISLQLLPRQQAPQFTEKAVINQEFQQISLNDYSDQYLVILFYPFDFTFVCPTEIIAFNDNLNKFHDLKTEVIAVSTDSLFSHLQFIKTPKCEGGLGEMKIPLIADFSKRMSKSYGVLVEDENDELFGASLRGLFIIDQKKVIRAIQINDAPVGRSVDETLRLIEAFQYTDKSGEVCPANWKKGSNTIIPDPKKKLEYFQSQGEM